MSIPVLCFSRKDGARLAVGNLQRGGWVTQPLMPLSLHDFHLLSAANESRDFLEAISPIRVGDMLPSGGHGFRRPKPRLNYRDTE